MRACIVGGGLAGAMLAWRLTQATTGWRIDLFTGAAGGSDATGASGGAVRAFEEHPEQRRLATASMVELLGSPTLLEWAGFRPAPFVSLRRTADGLADAVAEIELALPGSATLAGSAELAAQGWALGDRPAATAVVERRAGYTSPGRWRDAVLLDAGRRVAVLDAAVTAVTPRADGTITVSPAGGGGAGYDLVVVAAGAWTPALLRASGLPAGGYRTKSIQYAVHPVGGWCPPQFADEVTGLYGRPTLPANGGGLLLGLPTRLWDVDPDRPPTTAALLDTAAELAAGLFPRLRLGPATVRVGSADCYAEQPILCIRSVIETGHRLFTFTGGAGSSVKTALAGSHRAAIQLVETGDRNELTSVGRRKGQP